jgi:transcriptional regulator with XRE-family HTH domain
MTAERDQTAMQQDFPAWLAGELKLRGWSQRELARRAGFSQTTVSNVLAAVRKPTFRFCKQVAQALEMPADTLLILAGLRPPPPPVDLDEEEEILAILRNLSPGLRETIVTLLRMLHKWKATPDFPSSPVEQELLAAFRRVPDDYKEHIIRQAQAYHDLVTGRPLERERKIIGEETGEDEGTTTG